MTYRTVKDARNKLALDAGFDPFLHAGAKDATGKVWRKPTRAALAALGYPVGNAPEPKPERFTYGRSDDFNYAVARGLNRSHGVWDAVEGVGELYSIVEFDEIPECDWDRIDALEERVRGAK